MRPLRYLSLFSGIEAASVAWAKLDWEPVAFAQFDPEHDYSRGVPDFPSAVLAARYPHVPNLGDVTKIDELDVATLGQIDVVVFGSPCFTAGHLVLTARGFVPIESVLVGDMVWTHRSRWRAVTAVMVRTAPTVVVTGQGHNAMRATPDHPFYAAETKFTWNGNGYTRSLGEPQWVRAEEMARRRWATPTRVRRPDGCAPPKILATGAGAYLAGLYVGDGMIARRSDRKCLAVILSVNEAKRDKMLPALRAAWGTVSDMAHTQSTRRVQLSRTAVASALLDSFSEYSHAKTIPVWAFDMPESWRRAFLQGVLDTDGSPINNGWRVTTVSRRLAVGLRMLAAGLGYSTSLHFTARPGTCVIQGRTVNQRDTWTVIARDGNRTSELRDADFTWGLVRSVTDAAEATVFDITVDEDHSFVCDGITTHNCQELSVAGNRAGLAGERSGLFHDAVRIFRWARQHCGARFALWENVPGAFSSHKGKDFGVVVESLCGLDPGSVPVPPKGWGHEGFAVGPQGMVEWALLDAQWFGVAQRRSRLFALLDTGDWTRRPPILPLWKGNGGHPPTRGAQGQNAAPGPGAGAARGSGSDAGRPDGGGGGGGEGGLLGPGLTTAVDTYNGKIDDEIAHTLRDGHSEGTPGVIQPRATNWDGSDVAPTLTNRLYGGKGAQQMPDKGNFGAVLVPQPFDVANCLTVRMHKGINTTIDEGQTPVVVPIAADGPTPVPSSELAHAICANEARTYTNEGSVFQLRNVVAQPVAVNVFAGSVSDEVFQAVQAGCHSPDTNGTPHVLEPVAFDTKRGLAPHGYTMAVRRLTPRECERLQGFPEVRKHVTIFVCSSDLQKNSALAEIRSHRSQEHASSVAENLSPPPARPAGRDSSIPLLGHGWPVALHVQIDCAQRQVRISSQGRLLWSASTAGQSSTSRLSMPVEDFVRLAAHTMGCLVPTMQSGRGDATEGFTSRVSGHERAVLSASEIAGNVSDAERLKRAASAFTMSITSPVQRSSPSYEQTLQTWSCFVAAAIASYIPEQIRSGSSFALSVEAITDYLDITYRGKPASDSVKYKALGNSMCTNVIYWIGLQIDLALLLEE